MKTNESTNASELPEDMPAASSFPAGELRPTLRPRGEHNISRRDIDPDALKVLYRLARNGFTAYLVGGGVRDLLLGRKPKDFDISTDARPEQIRSLFRSCILIGRRFRLAHIRYGEKVIETSTFRGSPAAAGDPTDPETDLFQRDDNLFGSPQEDALRRDFTVNGLFYDISSFSIIDYVGGLDDLAERRIRCIGDPGIRFREDPVRMVRAVRFASRLGFSLEASTEEAMRRHGAELAKASPARLLEEITRLFAFSSGEKAVRILHSTGLLAVILPEVAACLDAAGTANADGGDLFWKRLRALDMGDTVLPDATPALIFATLLLDALQNHLGKRWTSRNAPKLKFERIHAFLEPLALRLRFPRRLVDRIVHMYLAQSRLHEPAGGGKRGGITNFVTQESFHEALALAEITLAAENADAAALNPWRDMLAERLFGDGGRESINRNGHGNRDGNGEGNGNRNGNGHENGPARGQSRSQHSDGGDSSSSGDAGDSSGSRLSRSARRRRNKRLRRQGGTEHGASAAPQGKQEEQNDVKETQASFQTPAKEDASTQTASSSSSASSSPSGSDQSAHFSRRRHQSRRGDGKKERGADQASGGSAVKINNNNIAERSAGSAEVIQPLTAAAFYTLPEPEPPAPPQPEEKKRGRQRKSSGKGKGKSAAEDSANPASPAAPAVPPPLRMDRADEADTPLHWLDEI